MIVHQVLPVLEPGAVGAHTLTARSVLRAAGHTSDIFATEVHPAWAGKDARPLGELRGADVLVYQMAIGAPAADVVLARDEPLVVNHHNLTPLRYFEGWEPVAAHGVVWGRAQLRALARRARLGVAVSEFNETELTAAGFHRTCVVPVLVDFTTFAAETKPPRDESPCTWLFVGRLAPNKAQHDIVKALAAYRRFHDPDARLVLVGSGLDDAYGRTLSRFVDALDLTDAVTLTGPVSDATLAAHYASADVLVVCSEHEGFCVPLLEAMYHGVPIVAYDAAALGETLGDAGILLSVKDPATVAAAVHRVVSDTEVRASLVAAGTQRLRAFDLAHTGPMFVDAVASVAA